MGLACLQEDLVNLQHRLKSLFREIMLTFMILKSLMEFPLVLNSNPLTEIVMVILIHVEIQEALIQSLELVLVAGILISDHNITTGSLVDLKVAHQIAIVVATKSVECLTEVVILPVEKG